MKKILQIIVAAVLIFISYKLMLPWHEFAFEHFEYKVASFLPFNWKIISVLSRLFIGLLIVLAVYLILENKKIKSLKYISILSICIPFIINPVFIKDLKFQTSPFHQELDFSRVSTSENEELLVFASANCSFCKEAILKLNVAQKRNKNFKNIRIIGYNTKINEFLNENNINFPVDSVSAQDFVNFTDGSFPKFYLFNPNEQNIKWEPEIFNYAVLDFLSQKE